MHSASSGSSWAQRLGWATLLILLAWWAWPLSSYWQLDPQYSYGWLVPIMAAYLFWNRLEDLPAASKTKTSRSSWKWAALALACFLPLRLVQEANPEWRLLLWIQGTLFVSALLLGVHQGGGKKWAVHLAFPIVFLLTAIPWPSGLEQRIVMTLTQWLASVNVEALHWMGKAALRHGSLIELSQGMVGVEEACSGIRSLQACIITALILGEVIRFSKSMRLFLALVGAAIATVANLLRSFALVWIATHGGPKMLEEWHDTVGWVEMLGGCALVCAVAFFFEKKIPPASTKKTVPAEKEAHGKRAFASGLFRRAWMPACVLAWIALVEIFTQGWYHAREQGMAPSIRWTLQDLTHEPGWSRLPINEGHQRILRFNAGQQWRYQANGENWQLFYFRWEPGSNAAQLVRVHRPEICLPSGGASLRQDFGTLPFFANSLRLPFHVMHFEVRQTSAYVFYLLWEDFPEQEGTSQAADLSIRSRLQAAWQGKRHRGQQVLEIIMFGVASARDAEEKLSQFVLQHVQSMPQR